MGDAEIGVLTALGSFTLTPNLPWAAWVDTPGALG